MPNNSFKEMNQRDFENFLNSINNEKVLSFLKDYEFDFSDILPNYVKNPEYVNKKLLFLFSSILEENKTGVVIAGFDKNFNRPSFANFDLFLNNDGKIEWECNYFKENFDGVSIFTFAQNSEIKSYIEGIDGYFEEEILNYWGDMLDILLNDLFEEIKNNKFDENIINDIKIKFESFKDKSESYKIMLGQEIDELKNKNNEYLRSIIELLPKQELADLTHFLIMIPSAKRRFSLDLNSVGGHIDVCLMSKVQFSWVDYE